MRPRPFLFALAVTVVLLNKILLVLDSVDCFQLSTYFWIPSVFLLDACFIVLVHFGLFAKSRVVFFLSTIVTLFSTLIVSFQVTAMMGHHSTIPWSMAVWTLSEWHHFSMIYKSKASESYLQVWMVVLLECLAACALVWLYDRRQTKSSDKKDVSLPRIQSNGGAAAAPNVESRQRRRQAVLYSIFYLLLCMSFRPKVPYSTLTQTPCISVPIEIHKGYKDYQRHKRLSMGAKRRKTRRPAMTFSPANSTNDTVVPLNVVFIFLESIRYDVMPFDGTTPWAKRFVPDTSKHADIAPFYSHLTKSNTTLYIPLMKSASGLTHKSLLSTLCSMMAQRTQGTTEPFGNFYHTCLPELLSKYYNYTSAFFQPQTEEFEHQRDLIQHIGFDLFYGQESYDRMYQPSEDFKKLHTANYFGYEDNIMLNVLGEWVENQTSPFLLSYLCGMTHEPYNVPSLIKWEQRDFSPDKRINDYLNTVAYLDTWLKNFMEQFRDLMDSTLFVILGDHGGNFYDHESPHFGSFDSQYEEGTNVGISFVSESQQWKNLLREMKPKPTEKNDNYHTSLDVMPSILQVLNIGNEQVLNGRYNNSWVDGQSMLLPRRQKRLRAIINNPGYTMVLREDPFLLMQRQSDTPEAFDLSVDPQQMNPLLIERFGGFVAENAADRQELAKWGEKAVQFLSYLEDDVNDSYQTGVRCHNCTLSFLLSNETIENWNPDEMARRSWRYFDGVFTDDGMMYIENWDGEEDPYDNQGEDSLDK